MIALAPSRAGAAQSSKRRRRPLLALVVVALVALVPIVAKPNVQGASRYALTAALVDRHSVDVGGYHVAVDIARYRGHLRSDKAPGQPILATPFYALGHLLGFRKATYLRTQGDLGMWWITLWSSMLPFAALLLMIHRAVRRYAPRSALAVTAVFGASTLLLPYAVELFGHVLTAAIAFGAWLVVDSARARSGDRWSLFLGGLLGGLAVAVEYEAAIVFGVVLAVVVLRHGRAAWSFVAGSAPPLLVTAWYQWAAFGAPWRVPYGYYAGVIAGSSRGGYTVPAPGQLLDVFASSNGLALLCPVVMLAFGAAVLRATQHSPERVHAMVATVIMVAYVVLVAGWSGSQLAQAPGPRYLLPAIPFLAVPFAYVWERARGLALVAAGWGALVMGAATVTRITYDIGATPVRVFFERVSSGSFSETLWSIAFGRAGGVLYLLSIAAVAVSAAGGIRSGFAGTNECSPELVPAANLAADEQHDRHSRRP